MGDKKILIHIETALEIPDEKEKSNFHPAPASKNELFELLSVVIVKGGIIISKHAKQRMSELKIDINDIIYIFKQRTSSQVEREWRDEYDSWCYEITAKDLNEDLIMVVVAIPAQYTQDSESISELKIVIVTVCLDKLENKRKTSRNKQTILNRSVE